MKFVERLEEWLVFSYLLRIWLTKSGSLSNVPVEHSALWCVWWKHALPKVLLTFPCSRWTGRHMFSPSMTLCWKLPSDKRSLFEESSPQKSTQKTSCMHMVWYRLKPFSGHTTWEVFIDRGTGSIILAHPKVVPRTINSLPMVILTIVQILALLLVYKSVQEHAYAADTKILNIISVELCALNATLPHALQD